MRYYKVYCILLVVVAGLKTFAQGVTDMVRKQKQAGYDYLKMHPGLSKEKFDSISITANKIGIPFVGHVSFGVGIWHAIDAGYSSIDHLDGFVEDLVLDINKMVEQQAGLFGMFVANRADTTLIPKLIAGLKAHHIRVVPTQSLAEKWFNPEYDAQRFKQDPHAVFMKPETVEQWINSKKNLVENEQYKADDINNFIQLRRRLIKRCHDEGVELLLGCDAPQIFNVPGFSTHEELQYLVKAGLTPYQALRTGTVNVAKYLNQYDAGVVKQGAPADLVLLNDNPLKDIRNTQNIEGVVLKGQWLPKAYLSSELKKLEKK